MRKIKLLFISFLFFFLLIFSYFILHDNCRSLNFFKSTGDFGTSYIKRCFSLLHIKENVKKRLVKYPSINNAAISYYRKYYLNKKNTKEKDFSFKNFSKIPFIKGTLESKESIENEIISSSYEHEYKNWQRSHGGNWNTKFHFKNDINKKNINKLQLVWKYSSIKEDELKKKWKSNIEVNPIHINNKIIAVTAEWDIVALNSENGNLIWKLESDFMPSRRGIVAEVDKKLNEENLFVPIGDVVYKINAKNGKIIKNFGNSGFVKAFTLVAPIIYKNNLVIVGRHKLLIFNKKNGEFLNEIQIHPEDINHYGGIVWGGAALDENKGIVYVTTGNPRPQLVGITRPGHNKRSNSIVAIDLDKKKVIWDFQETSHDLWDLDIGSPPIIHNLKIKENTYEVVIVVTKVGNTFILDRNSGKPIFDVTFKKAPKSKNKDEIVSPFQIYLEKPERFSKIEYGLEDINNLSKEKREEIEDILKNSVYGWYEPPSFKKNLISFGLHGGASWPGAAIDPINNHLFIPVNNIPWVQRNLIISKEINTNFSKEKNKYHKIYVDKCAGCHGKKRNGLRVKNGEKISKNIPGLVGYYTSPNSKENFPSLNIFNKKHNKLDLTSEEFEEIKKLFKWWDKKLNKNNEIEYTSIWYKFLTKDGFPASNPPWGYIAKLDLVSGKILYKSPLGKINLNGKIKNVGTNSYGGVALNSGKILFFTGTEDSYAYAVDADTGEELWSYKMNAAGSAPPIIYNANGKQYVSFVSTGGAYHNFKKRDSTIYTFSIVD